MPSELLTINDPPFGKIIRRHLNMDPIANDGPDSIAAHLAGCISNDPDVIIEHDPKPSVRHDLVDDTFDGEKFFLGHAIFDFHSPAWPLIGHPVASWR